MSRRKRPPAHANHERWLVSYADFITLLFAFFVVLYSSSQVDQRKVGKLALAIQVAFQELGVFPASTSAVPLNTAEPMPFNTVQAIENAQRVAAMGKTVPPPQGVLSGNDEGGDLSTLRKELEDTLLQEISRSEVALRNEPEGLVISLREIGFFESGSAAIRAGSRPAFDRLARLLAGRGYRIRIEGHTDNVPIHNSRFSDNWQLSTSRATELVRLMIVNFDFAPERLAAAGYAQYHPLVPNDSPQARALNRRVDIVVLRQSVAPGRSRLSAGP